MRKTAGAKRRADLAAASLAATLLFGAAIAHLSVLRPVPDAPAGFVCAAPEAGCGTAAVSISPDLSDCSGAARLALGGKLDLNRAGVTELDLVPGVGPATARALVAARQASGPFATVEAAVKAANVRGGGALKRWTEAGSRP